MSRNTNPLKRRRHDDEPTELDADKFEQLYVEWIADCGIALRMATRETFRALLKFLNPGVLSILPTSHQTIREWVMRTFETQSGVCGKFSNQLSLKYTSLLICGPLQINLACLELLPILLIATASWVHIALLYERYMASIQERIRLAL